MPDEGYISLYRTIRNNWVWKDKPFSKGQAWLDLILSANHKDVKLPFDGEIMLIERGSFVTSENKLADAWGWSRSKVTRFLDLLERDSMIARKSNNKRTTVTIENYEHFQKVRTANRTASEQPADTNNNDNNISLSPLADATGDLKKIFEHDSKSYRAAVYLSTKIKERIPGKNISEVTIQNWADSIDKLNRIDGQDWKTIASVLDFSQQDDFWQRNILSGQKLRKNFDQLFLKMQQEDGK